MNAEQQKDKPGFVCNCRGRHSESCPYYATPADVPAGAAQPDAVHNHDVTGNSSACPGCREAAGIPAGAHTLLETKTVRFAAPPIRPIAECLACGHIHALAVWKPKTALSDVNSGLCETCRDAAAPLRGHCSFERGCFCAQENA